jgi:hypothetical protein
MHRKEKKIKTVTFMQFALYYILCSKRYRLGLSVANTHLGNTLIQPSTRLCKNIYIYISIIARVSHSNLLKFYRIYFIYRIKSTCFTYLFTNNQLTVWILYIYTNNTIINTITQFLLVVLIYKNTRSTTIVTDRLDGQDFNMKIPMI